MTPHLVVVKWLAKVESCLKRCCTELRVGCLKMALRGTDYIRPITILAMAVTVFVIATMVAPFIRYRNNITLIISVLSLITFNWC